MFKLYNKVLGFFHSKPTINYLQPKSLNVYFSNSLNPKFHWINLKDCKNFSFEIIQTQNDTTNIFELKAMLNNDKEDEIIDLAKFETRKEAEEALLVLRNKFFAVEKGLIKTTGVVITLVVLLGLLMDFSGSTIKKVVSTPNQLMQPTNALQLNNGQMPPFMLSANTTQQELQNVQKQLLDAQASGRPLEVNQSNAGQVPQTAPVPEQAPAQPASTPEVSGNPDVNNLINSLGK